MKVKKVVANNRKKAFEITTSKGNYEFPYSRLEVPPSDRDPLVEVFPDREVAFDGFTYRLMSGKEDTILADRLLDYAKDPEYVRTMILFKLTLKARDRIKELGVSKREVIRRMGTTPTQFYRLMDKDNLSKTIDQMVKLLSALDCSVNFVVDEVA